MPDYRYKDAARRAYDANKKRIRVEAQILLDEMLNEAFDEMTRQFNEALNRGEILDLTASRGELLELLSSAAKRQLTA